MTIPPPDGSRDRRIEDSSNLWLIHPAGRALLPHALAWGLSANAASLIGLTLGTGAAYAYAQWQHPVAALVGFCLSVGWLIFDGVDGMIARATGTASAFGRFLDGLCDHGVFFLIYVALAASIGTPGAWMLAVAAGVAHGVQSSLYEGERARFHRRIKGVAMPAVAPPAGNPLVRLYDRVAGLPDRLALPFERMLANAADPVTFGQCYGERAAPAMKLMALLTANVRVGAVALACLFASPRLFWWFEIVALTAVAALAMARHRRIERALAPHHLSDGERLAPVLHTREHRHS